MVWEASLSREYVAAAAWMEWRWHRAVTTAKTWSVGVDALVAREMTVLMMTGSHKVPLVSSCSFVVYIIARFAVLVRTRTRVLA